MKATSFERYLFLPVSLSLLCILFSAVTPAIGATPTWEPLAATKYLVVQEMVVVDPAQKGLPVGQVKPGTVYHLRLVVKNLSEEGKGAWYDQVQVRVIPVNVNINLPPIGGVKAPATGVVLLRPDAPGEETVPQYNSVRKMLHPGESWSLEVPFKYTGSSKPVSTQSLYFDVGLYGLQLPEVMGWKKLRPRL